MNELEQYIADRLVAGLSGAAIEYELIGAGWSREAVAPVIHAQIALAQQSPRQHTSAGQPLQPVTRAATKSEPPTNDRSGSGLLITSLVLSIASMVPLAVMFFIPFHQAYSVETAVVAMGEMAISMLFSIPVLLLLWAAALVFFFIARSGGRSSGTGITLSSLIALCISPLVSALFFTLAVLFATVVGVMCGTTVSPNCGIL